ncbi:hypothetical protein GB931_08255 [Modestobacter sp. I12A-02628]|uniref:Uncharacterized protein n=1 Tax=Goekera deserti TaxID=2497753 RepID=A0A7K3WH65_9ACTN|nr:hypothetical protein [Goekera deserti]MPQ97915.1 hypothetical protein [Goekera deserti]NDI48561.1 hypothetical protein [Goekera deserti]NEL55060.1 hypothetical protein [Goekera deserti]
MTTLTLITLAVVIYGTCATNRYPTALALGGGTPVGAALVAGDTAVPTFYAVALGVPIGLFVRLLRRTRRGERTAGPPTPGVVALLLFTATSISVTLLAPLLFPGIRVLAPDGSVARLTPGVVSTSNIAQIVYLLLGVAVVLFLARSPGATPQVIGVVTGVVTLLSFGKLLSQLGGLPFPEFFFDNSPAFSFVDAAPGGQVRFRGILSEPAGLAGSSLVTIAYMSSRAVRVHGWHRVGAIAMAVIAAVMAVLSTSTTFIVAGLLLLGLAAGSAAVRIVLRAGRVSALTVTLGCLITMAGAYLLPIVAGFITTAINDKVGSSSYDERSGADARSYEIVRETYGLGVGLGAHRPSSFVAALLSTTGVLGTLLFVLAVGTLIWRASRVDAYRPVIWALVALLLTKVLAGPDLADTSGILWISLGLLARAARLRADRPGTAGAPGPRVRQPTLRTGQDDRLGAGPAGWSVGRERLPAAGRHVDPPDVVHRHAR